MTAQFLQEKLDEANRVIRDRDAQIATLKQQLESAKDCLRRAYARADATEAGSQP